MTCPLCPHLIETEKRCRCERGLRRWRSFFGLSCVSEFIRHTLPQSVKLRDTSTQWRGGRLPANSFMWRCSMRTDRAPGNRGAFEAARQKILKTQTICGICGKPVDFSYRAPHPLSPTVDHIIPVAKGGHPTDISNLQLAHRCCNRQKSDKLIEPRRADVEGDRLIPNDTLEQHCDWAGYRG